jgi:hypothetical protein
MLVNETELWQRLRALDDPDQLEFPADYHHRRARAQFERLVTRLDTDFGCRCNVDRDTQDATLHGRIEVPAPATAGGIRLVVSVSNFGGLAVISVENPGMWTDAEAAELLHADDAGRIGAALAELGYTLIPEEPLSRTYDGVWGREVFGRAVTWWDRYFGYL